MEMMIYINSIYLYSLEYNKCYNMNVKMANTTKYYAATKRDNGF